MKTIRVMIKGVVGRGSVAPAGAGARSAALLALIAVGVGTGLAGCFQQGTAP